MSLKAKSRSEGGVKDIRRDSMQEKVACVQETELDREVEETMARLFEIAENIKASVDRLDSLTRNVTTMLEEMKTEDG